MWTIRMGLCIIVGSIAQAGARAFLRKSDLGVADATNVHAQLKILEELEGALGQAHRQATERR
eukprot:CAMPEP_0179291552 /NCGR_PEP_ID=MMETSP0797-20121207/42396_1 /TAXON_ID=47934 /ORGANISM="Dinophysis acuminata, Strain DAEP01" /LENGTH=62 /DNA_ID=CAMNT_0021000631 /DNA_START=14 /DNA_END=198 /DNA_ORIENTATION=+